MTLTVYETLEQGSQEWLDARCGILTASQVHKLITSTGKLASNDTSRGLIETLVAERISGQVDYIHPSADMQRGSLDEPYARDLYAEHYAPVHEVGFAVREINGHKLGGSPDGLVDTSGGIEIKSRRPKTHIRTIITDTAPAENMAQIQALMLIFDRTWWDYVSYAGAFPLYVKRVHADPDWHALIVDALESFETHAALMERDYRKATEGKPVAPFIDHFAEIGISA